MTTNTDFLTERKALLADLSDSYYRGEPQVSDAEFDALFDEYVNAGGEPIVGHGFTVEESRKVRHTAPMESLKKISDDKDALIAWFTQMHDFWQENCDTTKPLTFSVSPKFDGLAAAVTVENGRVTMVATRGDGTVGENVTETALSVLTITALTAQDGTYYGEVLLPQENLAEANRWRADGDTPLSQIRNAAAGLIRREAKRKPRDTDAIFAAVKERVTNAAKTLVFANHNSGEYVKTYTYDQIVEKAAAILADFEPLRTAYPVAPGKHVYIDGVVFKVENADVRAGLGSSSGAPRWARAYKYADLIHESVVTGVEWRAPGKIGRITPVIHYNEIQIQGGKYIRATAHNRTRFLEFAPRVGDKILMKKSGDVIPYVVSIEHTGDGATLEVPTTCPTCGAATAVDGEFLVCTNDRISCDPVTALTLIITGLGIKGIQESIVRKVYDAHLTSYTDMHDALAAMKALPEGEISGVEGLGSKTEQTIKDALANAWENAPLANWLYGLNVDRVGSTVSETLESTYGSLDAIIEAIDDESKYREVQHLKGVNWAAIKDGRNRFVTLRDWIAANEVKAPVATVTVVHDDFWGGKKVNVTGSLPIPRADAQAWLKAHGATISSSFDILIDAGDGTSSKSVKAREKGKQVMLGAEFMDEHYNKDN